MATIQLSEERVKHIREYVEDLDKRIEKWKSNPDTKYDEDSFQVILAAARIMGYFKGFFFMEGVLNG